MQQIDFKVFVLHVNTEVGSVCRTGRKRYNKTWMYGYWPSCTSTRTRAEDSYTRTEYSLVPGTPTGLRQEALLSLLGWEGRGEGGANLLLLACPQL